MALPSALMLASMMLSTSAVWLEASIAHRRYEDNVHEHLRAMQAADGALTLCERDLRAGIAPVLPALSGAPMRWTKPEMFDGLAAYEPVPSWPGSASVPQCLIEGARVEGNPDAQAYWITARGFGAAQSTQAWVQRMIVREAGRERRAWRRIVTAPTAS
jgi:Tfp pilus assembly protein PilX